MADQHIAVYGICADSARAEAAVIRLKDAGFSDDSISVLFPSTESTSKFAHEKHTKAPEGATTGGAVGGALGGLLGLMVATGAPIVFPGVGLLLAAGPIAATLAGLGAGGAVGGFLGALIGLGIPEYEAKRYANTLSGGGVLISAHCASPEQVGIAEGILKTSGAEDVSSATESHPAVFL